MTPREIKTVLDKHSLWRNAEAFGECANLSSSNLIGANLIGANLIGANLIGANLIGANLSDANLIGANLSGANLSSSNLSDANLSGANLSGANLSDANLSGANLSGANLSGANLIGANLSGAKGVPMPDSALPGRVAAAILAAPEALDMSCWHGASECGTTHCLAGWAVVLTAGGTFLEDRVGTATAGQLLMPSASHLFYHGNDDALRWAREIVSKEVNP